MSKWEMVAFADVLSIINGKNQRQVKNPSGKYPIYGSGGVMGYADDYLCDGNTVVIGRKGTINRPLFVTEPFWNVDTAFGLCANNKILHPKFLFYFCENFDFDALNTTVTIPSLTKANLLKIQIPLPPLDVQKQIVAVLDRANSLIEKRKAQISKLDLLVKSQFIEMFGDPVTNPRGWEMTTIGEVCTLKSGTTFSKDKELDNGDFQYIKVSDMNIAGNEVYINTSKLFVSKETAKQLYMQPGTVIFPKRGGAIGTNKKRILLKNTCVDLNIMGVLPGQKVLTPYLYVYFLFIDLGSLYNGSSVPQINNKDIAPLVIAIPAMNLQNKFADFVKEVETQKSLLLQSLVKLELCYNSLMQKCFRGEIIS